jgi:hypothetical protein
MEPKKCLPQVTLAEWELSWMDSTYKPKGMSWWSLRFGHLINDKGDPDGIDIWTGLADQVFQTRHVGWFLVFPMPTVAFNLQNSGFIQDDAPCRRVGLIWICLEDPLSNYRNAHGATCLVVCHLHQCSFCHIHSECFRQWTKSRIPVILSYRLQFSESYGIIADGKIEQGRSTV